jgi:hypothetical protein
MRQLIRFVYACTRHERLISGIVGRLSLASLPRARARARVIEFISGRSLYSASGLIEASLHRSYVEINNPLLERIIVRGAGIFSSAFNSAYSIVAPVSGGRAPLAEISCERYGNVIIP